VLVDYQTVEPGDVSGEIDEAWYLFGQPFDLFNHMHALTVTLSVPTNNFRMDPHFIRQLSQIGSYIRQKHDNSCIQRIVQFDAVLTGTPNKPIYTTVARSHVHAAMDKLAPEKPYDTLSGKSAGEEPRTILRGGC
jgi:centromeric protein E